MTSSRLVAWALLAGITIYFFGYFWLPHYYYGVNNMSSTEKVFTSKFANDLYSPIIKIEYYLRSNISPDSVHIFGGNSEGGQTSVDVMSAP